MPRRARSHHAGSRRKLKDASPDAPEVGSDGSETPEQIDSNDHWDYGSMGRMAYQVSYGISYVLVYPVALVTRMIPKENAVVHGLVDGAMAARDAVSQFRGGSLESSPSGAGPALEAQPA